MACHHLGTNDGTESVRTDENVACGGGGVCERKCDRGGCVTTTTTTTIILIRHETFSKVGVGAWHEVGEDSDELCAVQGPCVAKGEFSVISVVSEST